MAAAASVVLLIFALAPRPASAQVDLSGLESAAGPDNTNDPAIGDYTGLPIMTRQDCAPTVGRPKSGSRKSTNASHVPPTVLFTRQGYLRKNGGPYGEKAVFLAYFERLDVDGKVYLVVTGIAVDPEYLNSRFITAEQFSLEPNGRNWNPTPCRLCAARSRSDSHSMTAKRVN